MVYLPETYYRTNKQNAMEIYITRSYEDMSKQAADDLIALTQPNRLPLICTASGDSPAGLYKELITRVQERQLNTANWYFVGLDEWSGMNGKDEGSCRWHLDKQLFHPLQVAADHLCFFDGMGADPEAECTCTENYIKSHGGIDVAIVGLGLNGHIGMNEPGTSQHLYAHIAAIDPLTQQSGQKYFRQPRRLEHGLTLGIADLMEARHVMLLVSGKNKAGVVQQVIEGPMSEQVPASLMRQHRGFRVYLDKEAAAMLQREGHAE
jgi:glucosamine-6-phosphate isomerase